MDRWCPRERRMRPWVKALMGRSMVKVCLNCRALTRAHAPKPPKHQAADRRAAVLSKARHPDGCEHCDRRGYTHDAHAMGKKAHPKLRHHPDNRVRLAPECHDYFTRHPAAWRAWLESNRPDLYAQLQEMAR